uniref:Uncharacterized protein n=1 Tax=Medicago truncatula TaxID=3880 RepID=I3SNA0_MEDTR|nr:unknown [Medicago truncatula]
MSRSIAYRSNLVEVHTTPSEGDFFFYILWVHSVVCTNDG